MPSEKNVFGTYMNSKDPDQIAKRNILFSYIAPDKMLFSSKKNG